MSEVISFDEKYNMLAVWDRTKFDYRLQSSINR